MADFYHPPLPDPIIEYDDSASSYFYIDTLTWTVHLNTVGVPLSFGPSDAEWYLRSICQHEIQHYMRCPYDEVTSGMMLARAKTHLDEKWAIFVCNLFSDLVVDSYLLRRFNRLTCDRLNASIQESTRYGDSQSPLWQLIVAVHKRMWNIPLPASCSVNRTTISAARDIVEVARKYLDNERRWHIATEKIAKIVKEWLFKNMQLEDISCMDERDSISQSDTPTRVPPDVDEIMGDPFQIRNRDTMMRCSRSHAQERNTDKDMERLALEVEQRGGDLRDLEGVYITVGVRDANRGWIRFWYRAKTKRMLRIEGRVPRRTTALPMSTDVWRLGEPIEELDLVQSLLAFPVLVPNMSTRRWNRIEGTATSNIISCPDVLIVIDSSGSMTWSMNNTSVTGPYHYALLAAFAAIEAVLRQGRRVAVINFSDGIKTCPFTSDRTTLEKALLQYQGGGTIAPLTKIEEVCRTAETPVLILFMTDTEISNWNEFVHSVQRLTARRHVLYLFCIGGAPEHISRELSGVGAHIVSLTSPEDLLAQSIFFNPRLD